MVQWLGQGPDYIDVPPLPGPTDIPTPSNEGLPPETPWPVEKKKKKEEWDMLGDTWRYGIVAGIGVIIGAVFF